MGLEFGFDQPKATPAKPAAVANEQATTLTPEQETDDAKRRALMGASSLLSGNYRGNFNLGAR